jgi:hypothetical protein
MTLDLDTLIAYARDYGQRSGKVAESEPGAPRSSAVRDATACIFFSTAAVECALNLAVCAPVLLVRDPTLRRYFGTILTKYARLSWFSRLALLREMCPTLGIMGTEEESLRRLFSLRNQLVHAAPDYQEALDPKAVFDWMESKGVSQCSVDEQSLPTTPVLDMGVNPRVVMDEARKGLQVAMNVVKKLQACTRGRGLLGRGRRERPAPNPRVQATASRVTALAGKRKGRAARSRA